MVQLKENSQKQINYQQKFQFQYGAAERGEVSKDLISL